MKILVVGAGGDIGKAASEALADRHEIITAGRSSGDIRVDLSVPCIGVRHVCKGRAAQRCRFNGGGCPFRRSV